MNNTGGWLRLDGRLLATPGQAGEPASLYWDAGSFYLDPDLSLPLEVVRTRYVDAEQTWIHLADGRLFISAGRLPAELKSSWSKPKQLLERYESRLHRRPIALVLLLLSLPLVAVLAYRSLPWLGDRLVPLVSPSVEQKLGDLVLKELENLDQVQPSLLTTSQQQQLSSRFQFFAEATTTVFRYRFYQFGGQANALALPGGTIILTDELVSLFESHPEWLAAIVAHEIGHLHHRHGTRMLIRSLGLGLFWQLLSGADSGQLGPLTMQLIQFSYSRSFELAADDFAVNLLDQLGIDGHDALAKALTELTAEQVSIVPAWLSTHPDTAERISRLLDAP